VLGIYVHNKNRKNLTVAFETGKDSTGKKKKEKVRKKIEILRKDFFDQLGWLRMKYFLL